MNSRAVIAAAAAIVLAAIAAACTENPVGATIGAPSIACDRSVTVASPTGVATTVQFVPPVALGESPLSTTCVPPSGSAFGVGTTKVTCTARDPHGRTASCELEVTVTAPPRLTATKFMAFGDSMTAGELNTTTCPGQTFTDRLGVMRIRYDPKIFDPTRSYPPKLQTTLNQRYTGQSSTVFNDGLSAERVEDGAIRFRADIAVQNPQVTLIFEGANNFLGGNDLTTSTPQVIEGLRSMIRDSKARGAIPFVANQLPKRAGSCRGGPNSTAIPGINDQIRAMVFAEGVGDYFVDLYSAFGGVASTELISVDGLHPTEAGNDRIAQTFYAAIRARLELSQTTALPTDEGSVVLSPGGNGKRR